MMTNQTVFSAIKNKNLPEQGEELRAPGGIVVVTAIATETGGDGGVEDIVF